MRQRPLTLICPHPLPVERLGQCSGPGCACAASPRYEVYGIQRPGDWSGISEESQRCMSGVGVFIGQPIPSQVVPIG